MHGLFMNVQGLNVNFVQLEQLKGKINPVITETFSRKASDVPVSEA
jgi:hypothetical protein